MKIERLSYIIDGMSEETYEFVRKFYNVYDSISDDYIGGKAIFYEKNFFISNYQRFAEILHDAIPAVKLQDIRIAHPLNGNMSWFNSFVYSYDIGFDNNDGGIHIFKKQIIEKGIVL